MIGDSDDTRVMRAENEGCSEFAVHPLHKLENALPRGRIEVRRRFIGQNQGRGA